MLIPKNAALTEKVGERAIQILRLLNLSGPMKVHELIERTGEKPEVIGAAIRYCVKMGLIDSKGRFSIFMMMLNRPTFSISEQGRELLAQHAISVNRPKRKPKRR